MNKLNFLIVCESAFLADISKNLNLINVFDTISTNGFPASHPKFSVATSFETTSGSHKETLIIKKGIIEIIKTENSFVGDKHRWINNLFNIKFPEEGRYEVNLYIDNTLIGSTYLDLIKI